MSVTAYPHFGGIHPETAALRNVLISRGFHAPHTGQPFSEALLFGIGGGIGAGYWVFEFPGIPPAIAVGARHNWQSPPGTFAITTSARLGARVDVRETTGRKGSDAALRETLERGQPAILAADRASLPHSLLPEEMIKGYYHVVVAVGFEAGTDNVLVDDLAPHGLSMSFEQLANARGAITSMKRRMVVVSPGAGVVDLPAAIDAGVGACVDGLLNPPIRNFGLASIEKWADLSAHPRDKKGWPTVFTHGPKLYHGLSSAARWIEAMDTGGGLMRGMYADFLDQAHSITGRSDLKDAASRYRALAGMWSDLAATALPDAIPPLGETRRLLVQRDVVFRERGADAFDDMRAIDARLSAIAAEMESGFPLSHAASMDLLADMRDRLLAIHVAEVEAAEALAA
ncbi:MAG TPA: DUF4872 domain-containing protein [Thermomicrobiales bacterium]|nr:DUF4872 domain-containing protein [Thermomicrobiales bacterium]